MGYGPGRARPSVTLAWLGDGTVTDRWPAEGPNRPPARPDPARPDPAKLWSHVLSSGRFRERT